MPKRTTSRPHNPIDPETLFWRWVEECVKPRCWFRYSPDLARALADHQAALIVAYGIHLDGRGSGQYSPGRWFYKSIEDWAAELYLTPFVIETRLKRLCWDWKPRDINYSPLPDAKGRIRKTPPKVESLGLFHRWFASSRQDTASGVYHYRVNWPRLLEWWKEQAQEYGQMPLALSFSNVISSLPAARQLGENRLTGKAKTAKLVSPSTLNQLGLYGPTSGEISTLEDPPPEEQPASASASERQAASANLLVGSFGHWLQGDSAQAITRLFRSDGWKEDTITDALWKAYERRHRYVDVVEIRERLKQNYDQNPELTQWPGYFAKCYLQGF